MAATRLAVRVLGPLDVARDGARVELARPRLRQLLALLVVGRGRVVSANRLIDELWDGEEPAGARHALHTSLSRLRSQLEPDRGPTGDPELILTEARGYRLDPARVSVDRDEFEDLAARAQEAFADAEPAATLALCDRALGLWRGEAFADVETSPMVVGEAVHLHELLLTTREVWADAALAQGRQQEVIPTLETVVRDHPTHERFWGLLMRALHAAGRQTDALAAYTRARHLLVSEYGVEPGEELQRVHAAVLRHDQHREPPHAYRSDGPRLPAPITRFVGRREERQTVRSALEADRLVTLTGLGGSGKTRLALEIGRRWATGPVWFVELAGDTADSLVGTIRDALGLRDVGGDEPLDTVAEHVGDEPALLILDNSESVADACRDVCTTLLRRCPRLRILVTSRIVLGLTGETVTHLGPLALPTDAELAGLAAVESVELLLDRVRLVRPGFRLTEENAPAISTLCHHLDGIPLSLELAASWFRVLTPDAMVTELDRQLWSMTTRPRGGEQRHRSLRAAIQSSLELLEPSERTLLRRLTVFRGPFEATDVDVVCAGDGLEQERVLVLLARLVDASLVEPDTDAPLPYRLLEPVRQHAFELLVDAGEAPSTRHRHLGHFTQLAEEARPQMWSHGQVTWRRRLRGHNDDLRAALGWALESGRADDGLRLAAALWWFWWRDSDERNGRLWLERTLAAADTSPSTVRAQALRGMCVLSVRLGMAEDARRHGQAAVSMSQTIGDRAGYARGCAMLASCELDTPRSRELLDEALEVGREVTDHWAVESALLWSGVSAHVAGDLPAAAERLEASLAMGRELGNWRGLVYTGTHLAALRRNLGDLQGSGELLAEMTTLAEQCEDTLAVADCLDQLALTRLADGDADEATTLHEEAKARRALVGIRVVPGSEELFGEQIKLLRGPPRSTTHI